MAVVPQVVWVGGSRPWELATPFIYYSEELNEEIIVPAGYQTDLASVPRIPFVYARYGGRAVLASILHDYMYEVLGDKYSRKQADRVFLEAMRKFEEPGRYKSRMMYTAVRVFGWAPWRRYRNG